MLQGRYFIFQSGYWNKRVETFQDMGLKELFNGVKEGFDGVKEGGTDVLCGRWNWSNWSPCSQSCGEGNNIVLNKD